MYHGKILLGTEVHNHSYNSLFPAPLRKGLENFSLASLFWIQKRGEEVEAALITVVWEAWGFLPGSHISKLREKGRSQWVGRKWSKLGVNWLSTFSGSFFSFENQALKTWRKACTDQVSLRSLNRVVCVPPKHLATLHLNKTKVLWIMRNGVCWLTSCCH